MFMIMFLIFTAISAYVEGREASVTKKVTLEAMHLSPLYTGEAGFLLEPQSLFDKPFVSHYSALQPP